MSNTQDKLDKYRERLKAGKAHKIKPKHIHKMVAKLEAKLAEVEADLAATDKPAKRERLGAKLRTLEDQIGLAKWLEEQL